MAPGGTYDREALTQRKKELIRLVVGFVFATKHYLRSEGGVHHADLQGLLPHSLVEFVRQGSSDDSDVEDDNASSTDDGFTTSQCSSPRSMSALSTGEEEHNVGLTPPHHHGHHANPRPLPPPSKSHSFSFNLTPNRSPNKDETMWVAERKLVRRPTAVRVRKNVDTEKRPAKQSSRSVSALSAMSTSSTVNERTPLIKSGVRADTRRRGTDPAGEAAARAAADGMLGHMVEVGLPLIIAHEISRTLFRFRRGGNLEDVGPAVSRMR